MGNPSSGSKVQTTMPLPKGRHRQSLSVGASLEKLAPHEKWSSHAEKQVASGKTLSPRTTEEKSIAAFLGDKKMKRRTRSSLGGSEEFIKGFELNGVAVAAEDRKPLSSIPFRGQRRATSGNVTPRAAESPRAKVICTQGAEKNTVAKSASSLFHSPTNLGRSMSLSRLAHRTIPEADGSTPRSRTGVLREATLPSERGTLLELKRHDYQREAENKLQASHTSENGSGRRSSSVLLEKNLEGLGPRKIGKTAVPYAHDIDENLHSGASMELLTDSWSNHEQMYWNPAYLPVKDIHPVCFETTPKLRSEQPMTSRSLDMGYDLHEFVRRSSFSTVTSAPLPCSSRGSNPSGPEEASNPTLKSATSLHSEPQRANVPSTHGDNSYRLNHCGVQANLNSFPGGPETSSFESQGQPFPIATPSRKQSIVDLTRQDVKNLHCHPLPLPPTSKISQVKVKDIVGTQKLDQKIPVSCSSDKVSEEDLTEAAFLSSLVCDDVPAGPLPISEESKQLVMNASQVEEIIPIREEEVGLRNTSDPGACLGKSTSVEPELEEKARVEHEEKARAEHEEKARVEHEEKARVEHEEKARVEHEKKTKLRKRRRSVSASGIGAMLLKVVRVSDTGPLETKMLPTAELENSRVDPMQSRDCCVQTSTVPSMGQPESATTSLNEDVTVEMQKHKTEAVDMDSEYQDCSVELATSDVDACHKVNAEGASANKDTKPLLEREDLSLQIVGDAQETKIASHAEGSQFDLVANGSQEVFQDIADSELGTSSPNSNIEQDKREIPSEMLIANRALVHFANENSSAITENDPNKELLEERTVDDAGVLKGPDCVAHQKETSSTSAGHGSKGSHQEFEKGNRQQALVKNARLSANSSLIKKEEGPGGSRRKLRQGHKGRVNSYDLDSSTDCRLKKPDMSETTETEESRTTTDFHNKGQSEPLALLDENVAITRESTRPARSSVVSMLQVSPRQFLDDDYHLGPSSISILANPSFSSSHQDRIWEEQAEAYSSGGRGTPGREDDTATNVFLHSPSPGGAISSDDQNHSAAHGSLRRGQGDTSVRLSTTSGFPSDNGKGNEKRKSGQSKKRGRPRTPLRSLLAEDLHGKTASSRGRSPESHGHFLQQLMSRIRGSSSSKSSSPKSEDQAAMPKTRRTTIWSSCLCFPH